ncbi:uncharacterized protein LOC132759110 [Ruditapes philippinarum]|uniref:uncharacterized protein LOC132759110 n=1 Tax=Ruditapes philippinarum TaxID=129788 RepID=UPI00295B1544|nr:uncharacterized protein LOC132759110 [Ruditapes philippinarum]
MFQKPEEREHLSLMLSEVLDDICINERMVKKRRKVVMLIETMSNMAWKSKGDNFSLYCLGSQSEGTTTPGLQSDTDMVYCNNEYNIIQDMSEWERGKVNYLMIQDVNTSPGYCFLQLFDVNTPLPITVNPDANHIVDRRGRILRKNTLETENFQNITQHGPSLAMEGQQGFSDTDRVIAYPCKSWPKLASCWLERQDKCRWPTQRMGTASGGCFVVPTGSKVSVNPELEWRISTSLTERCLMFDSNITQLRCYFLMKMVLKSCLNPRGEINISSFMCKTVLLHTIESTEPSFWKESNLTECLRRCFMELHSCVQKEYLSHFIIRENNLMAGQFTDETKHQLLENISDFIQNDVQCLLTINRDNLGQRLQVKLNLVRQGEYSFDSSLEMSEHLSAELYVNFARQVSSNHRVLLKDLHDKDTRTLKQSVETLLTYRESGNKLEKNAYKFLAPFLFSTYGSALASADICLNNQISPQAFVWLSSGLDSDVSSGRLKLASAFYSEGDMKRTELILRQTERQYNSCPLFHICRCCCKCPERPTVEFKKVCNEQSLDCVKQMTADCVIFTQQEVKCIPQELQYELFRSTQDDMLLHREEKEDYWMDWVVVDSLPFIYFLQYKIYRRLQRYQDTQHALCKLIRTIEEDKDIAHKETALNILGQCLEQEHRPKLALKCYLLSLRQRPRNNVANDHICRLLSGMLVGK